MPRINVPVVDSQQVQTGAIPTVRQDRASAEQMGAGLARGLNDVAGVVGKYAAQEKEKADTLAVQSAETQLKLGANELMFGDDGALQRKGKNALNITQEYEARFGDLTSKIRDTLTDDRQKAAFDSIAMQYQPSYQANLLKHSRSEMEAYATQEFTSYVESAVESATLAYKDPERVELELARLHNVINSRSVSQGWAPEATREALDGARSAVHLGVITRAVEDKDWQYASRYFDENKDYLEPAQLSNAAKLVEQAKVTGQADLNFSNIVNSVQDIPEPPVAKIATDTENVSFNDVIEPTFKTEGGYLADDAGAGPTNFGINSRANPDVDVKNLTKDEAAKIYKERYWDAIGADSLPSAIRAIAFDAAVNQGPEKSAQWAEQSGGDPAKYMKLRKQHYDMLVRVNPSKYSKHYNGWMNRLSQFETDDAEARLDLPGRTLPTLSDYLAKTVDIKDPAERALTQKKIKAWFNDTVKPQREEMTLEAANMIESGVAYLDLPASLRGQLSTGTRNSLRKLEKTVAAEGGGGGTDALVSFNNRHNLEMMAADPARQQEFIEVDVVAARASGALNKEDAAAISKLQIGLAKGDTNTKEKLTDARNLNQLTTDYLAILKIDPKKKPEQANDFRMRVTQEVNAFEKIKGAKSTEAEQRDILNRLTEQVSLRGNKRTFGPFEFFTGDDDTRAYLVEPGTQLNAPSDIQPQYIQLAKTLGLPETDEVADTLYTIQKQGVPESDRQQITDALRSKGLAVTEDKIFKLYIKKNMGGA